MRSSPVRSSLARSDSVQFSSVRFGSVQCNLTQSDQIQSSLVQSVPVKFSGFKKFSPVSTSVVRFGQSSLTRFEPARFGFIIQSGPVQSGAEDQALTFPVHRPDPHYVEDCDTCLTCTGIAHVTWQVDPSCRPFEDRSRET